MTELLRVGGASIPFDEAFEYARTYVTNTTLTWSYPAYDAYPGSPTDTVAPPDLLAVSLLNAGQKPVVTYYGLENLLPEINVRLMVPEMKGDSGRRRRRLSTRLPISSPWWMTFAPNKWACRSSPKSCTVSVPN